MIDEYEKGFNAGYIKGLRKSELLFKDYKNFNKSLNVVLNVISFISGFIVFKILFT